MYCEYYKVYLEKFYLHNQAERSVDHIENSVDHVVDFFLKQYPS